MFSFVIFLVLTILGIYALFRALLRVIEGPKPAVEDREPESLSDEEGFTTCTGTELPPLRQECAKYSLVKKEESNSKRKSEQHTKPSQPRAQRVPRWGEVDWMKVMIYHELFCTRHDHHYHYHDHDDFYSY